MRDPLENFCPHAHELSGIAIIVGGKGLRITEDESRELSIGDVFVIGSQRAPMP